MTTESARRTVALSLTVIAGITFVREVKGGKLPGPRLAVGAFAAGVILTSLAGPLPDVAAGLALTALVAHAMSERGTLDTIAGIVKGK